MGLDTYAMIPNPDFIPDSEDEKTRFEYNNLQDSRFDSLKLCGGMFSECSAGSFRGKVYNAFIEHVTGESLYQEEIPPETVKQMAEKLAAYDGPYIGPEEFERQPYDSTAISKQEADDLATFFAVAAEHDAIIHGWW